MFEHVEPAVPCAGESGRIDAHNTEVDESAVHQGLCGMTHLNTGNVCRLPERHPGGCEFVLRD